MGKKAAFTPRASYDFASLKPGDELKIRIPKDDPAVGLRALTAAYAFMRRHNEGKKRSQHVRFAGRLNRTGTVRIIHRVR